MKNDNKETLKELTIRNAEKIDMIMEEIKEIQRKLECIIKIKEELAIHKTYFKILGGLSGGLITLIIGIILKLL
ncbi:MAG: hypothetical protein H5T45_01460 [Thermoplasmatales archaeon]|nr:hypothetical protein [Thermoplasmatales archaeon]